jgi:hypothetical protein
LIVNKTLIEGAAVGLLLAFNTGAMAGLDMLLAQWKSANQPPRRQDRQEKVMEKAARDNEKPAI